MEIIMTALIMMTSALRRRPIIMDIIITKMDAIIMASMVRARAVLSLEAEQQEAVSVQDTETGRVFIFSLEK